MLWTKLVMEEQSYKIDENILNQDNKSAFLLVKDGRNSTGKQSCALNEQYFFISDQVDQGNLNVQHCPIDKIIGII